MYNVHLTHSLLCFEFVEFTLILQYTALVALGTQLARDLATIGLVTICKCQEVPISATHSTIKLMYINYGIRQKLIDIGYLYD